jgi:hypothetical protein
MDFAAACLRRRGRASKVITGFDRHSVRSATQKIAYVAASRGREDIEVFVESIADLSQIQNRSGGRNGFRQFSRRAGRG